MPEESNLSMRGQQENLSLEEQIRTKASTFIKIVCLSKDDDIFQQRRPWTKDGKKYFV